MGHRWPDPGWIGNGSSGPRGLNSRPVVSCGHCVGLASVSSLGRPEDKKSKDA